MAEDGAADSVFCAVEGLRLFKLAVFILYHNKAGLVKRLCPEVNARRLRGEAGNVNSKRNNRNNTCNKADGKYGENKFAFTLENGRKV